MPRRSGKHALLAIGAYTGADLYEWELTVEQDTAEVTGLDDDWKAFVLGAKGWTLTASKYYTSEAFIDLLAGQSETQPTVTVTCKDPADDTSTVFQGSGIITEGTLNVPNEAVTQRITIRGSGTPAIV